MAVPELFDDLGVTGTAFAAPIGDGEGIGLSEHDLVTPASVLKIQVALTVENAMTDGSVDGTEIRTLHCATRTPGPVGISLLHDDVRMSVRDLVPLMLTISDNVATDELLSIVGVEQVNRTTERLGLRQTRVTSDLRSMLDDMAVEAGFADYPAMVRHDPARGGSPSEQVVRRRLAATAALDPERGSRTTAFEMVSFLQTIWWDEAGPAAACAAVRRYMGQQLTRHRIASGFGHDVSVAAKSGGLMGVVRNEAGVVTFPDDQAYAVAVFTRRDPRAGVDPAAIDAGIGSVAHALVTQLRTAE
ncbi:MAG: serine hydrolase [Nocardioidaceae bacterium]